MTTQLQTVEVQYPFSPLTFLSMERCPVAPPEIQEAMKQDKCPYGLKVGGVKYYWFLDGVTIVVEADGTVKSFWPRFTLNDAITYRKDGCVCDDCAKAGGGGFFQFHKDGSATSTCFGKNYFWGKPEEAAPISTEDSDWLSPHGGYGAYGWNFYYNDGDIDNYRDYPDSYSERSYDSDYRWSRY